LMAKPMTMPAGAVLMALGALAMAQGSQDQNAAGQSGATAAVSAGSSTAGTATNPAFGTGTDGFQAPGVKAAQASLANAGYTLTPTGLTTPDGTVVSNSSLASSGGMAKAGLDAQGIKEVKDVVDAMNKEIAKVSGMAVAEGAGGGASHDSVGRQTSSYTSGFNASAGLKKSMIAGKTVLFDGDPIGVRGQNIFDMVHTCYDRKRQRNDFMEENAAVAVPVARATSAASRTPSSVTRPKSP